MLFEETRSIRAFVGRIDAGDDVVEALTLVCSANDIESATVRLTGTLSNVELAQYDSKTKGYRTIVDSEGPFHVANLTGRVAALGDQTMLQLDALLAAQGPAGTQLAFGELRRGNAVDCEFVIETFADLEIDRKPDAATGRFPISAIRSVGLPAPAVAAAAPAPAAPPRERKEPETISKPAGSAPAKPPGEENSGMSWADAMEASDDIKPASRREPRPISTRNEREKAADPYANVDFDEPLLKAGDILKHPKLGECRVIKVEDDEYAHIRLSRGQIRKLALELIQLTYEGDRDGKNVFKVRVGK